MKSLEFNQQFKITGVFINYKIDAIREALKDHGYEWKEKYHTSYSTNFEVVCCFANSETVFNIFNEALKNQP